MSVTREEIERIARLAALAVDQDALRSLTTEIGRILEYVSTLESADVGTGEIDGSVPNAESRQPLRPDEVRRTELAVPLEALAPRFEDGLLLVPRLGALDQE